MTDIDFRNLKKDEWYNIGGMYYKILGKSDNVKNLFRCEERYDVLHIRWNEDTMRLRIFQTEKEVVEKDAIECMSISEVILEIRKCLLVAREDINTYLKNLDEFIKKESNHER